jgi:hypothetical protein
MLANHPGPKKKLRAALAFTLVLWCAGAGCALGTYAHAAMGDHELGQAQAGGMAMTGLSGAAGAHSCCKARHASEPAPAIAHRRASGAAELNEVALPEPSNSSEAMSCCPLTSGTFLVTTRQSVGGDHASAATKSDAPALVLVHIDATPLALPLRLPNQDHTYLRCCSFLI